MQEARLPPFHLAVAVDDIAAARRFYGELLGCPRGRSAESWVDFDFFGHQLVVHLAPNGPASPAGPDAATNAVDGDAVPVPHFGAVLSLRQWEELAARLQASGVEFVIPPRIRFAGAPGEQATMFFRDPAGNAIELKAFADPEQLFRTSTPTAVGPSIQTERTHVRLARLAEAGAVLEYLKENGHRYDPPVPAREQQLRACQEHIVQHVRQFRQREALRLYVFAQEDREVIGTIQLHSIQAAPLAGARLDYGIAGSREGQGLMREALEATLHYAFRELDLHRVEATHAADDHRSAKLLTRLGFHFEGIRKSSYLSRGRWCDTVLRARLAPEP